MIHNAERTGSCANEFEHEGGIPAQNAELEEAGARSGPVENLAMELPSGSSLRVFGTLFPTRGAGARAAIGATNELRTAEPGGGREGEPVWLTVPYGIYAHPRGTQVVDEESALEMARHFSQIWSRLARGFRGLPVYIGHPDARGRTPEEQAALAREYPDKRAYGWVEALEAGDDGLRLLARWEPAGLELVQSEEYAYFSPHWGMLPILEQPGRYRPVELYSLGLTNYPNIPGLTLREVRNDAEGEAVSERDAEDGPTAAGLRNASVEAVINEVPAPVPISEEAQLREVLNEERRARCQEVVSRALEEGRISLAWREQWLRNLELDYVGNERLLKLLPAIWNTGSGNPVRGLGAQCESLGLERAMANTTLPVSGGNRRRPDRIERIAREVTRRQQEARTALASATPGERGPEFHEIYQGVKKDHPEWFAEA